MKRRDAWNAFLSLISIAPIAKKRRKQRAARRERLESRELLTGTATAHVDSNAAPASPGEFRIDITGATNENVTVYYSLAGSAVGPNEDPAIPSGGSVDFQSAQGSASKTVSITPSTDDADDDAGCPGSIRKPAASTWPTGPATSISSRRTPMARSAARRASPISPRWSKTATEVSRSPINTRT